MYWKKLGKIFDPSDYNLANSCIDYAQSPQVLVKKDCIRIYFSTRARDSDNTFVSHVAYVDMSKDLETILNVSNHTVIPLGELGTFDEHGIFPINVVEYGGKISAYTCGWSRRASVSVETGVGYAESKDGGTTFEKLGHGPILTSSTKEPFLVGDAFVKVFDGTYHMWYMFGTRWKEFGQLNTAERIYKIGHAVSDDGIHWVKEEAKQIIPDKLHEDESMALPSVIRINEQYHMFFCYRESFNFRKDKSRGYRIGHAVSMDLSNWTRADDSMNINTSESGWDSDMLCYPHVFENDDKIYLLYNGNEFGRHGFGIAVLEQ
ncbi:hypothetical protein [Thalassotalea sp. SU-HH00458]|uniref:hypothetical protein n=1 Tax=Thalassotalea sp. SU-HH00458 TaxID=3127657 RepID=UPI003104DB2C